MRRNGFSYTELVIILAVIAGIGYFAFPAYKNFKGRRYFDVLKPRVEKLRQAVAVCYSQLKTLKGCSLGASGLPTSLSWPNVATVSVQDGVIRLQARPIWPLTSATDWVMQPSVAAGKLVWKSSGVAVQQHFVETGA